MKTISLSVSEKDYAAFRRAAREQNRSIAQMIREAMAIYREQRLMARTRLSDLAVLVGHRPVASLPSRNEIYDEVFGDDGST